MLDFIKSGQKYSLAKGFSYAENNVRKKAKNKADLAYSLCVLARESYKNYPYESIRVMEESNDLAPRDTKVKWIGFKLYDLGNINDAYLKLSNLPKETFGALSEKNKLNRLLNDYRDMVDGVKFSSESTQNKSLNTDSAQEKWFKSACNVISGLKNVSAQKFYPRSHVKVGVISENSFFKYIESAADCTYLTPDNYEEIITGNGIDILLMTSLRAGIDAVWNGIAVTCANSSKYVDKRAVAIQLISLCKTRNIPVVFYSVEGADLFDNFAEFAESADYVYTADPKELDLYRSKCVSAKTVEYLPLGINPLVCNPVGVNKFNDSGSVSFSGIWLRDDLKRCAELTKIFNGILASKKIFHIVDASVNIQSNGYGFPDSFKSYTVGCKDILLLSKIHRSTGWSVSYNFSGNDSEVIAGNTFEHLASGCLVLSNYQKGLAEQLPSVFNVYTSDNVQEYMKAYNTEEILERRLWGLRDVMNHHTCFSKINLILRNASLESEYSLPKVLVIGTDSDVNRANFERQTYKAKSFISSDEVNKEILADYDVVTWFDEGNYYREFYLEDMLNAFKYTDAGFVTRDAYLSAQQTENDGVQLQVEYGVEHYYVDSFKDKYLTVFWKEQFDSGMLLDLNFKKSAAEDEEFLKNLLNQKTGYSVDHQNIVKNYGLFEKYGKENKLPDYLNYRVSVVIPVQNNGGELYGRALSGLIRSSMFKRIEVILACEGNSNDNTLSIISYLITQYSNIKTCFCDKGCSRSELMNRGMAIASGEYITFLNPEDDSLNDGYAKLWEESVDENFDIIIGNNYFYDNVFSRTVLGENNYELLTEVFNTSRYESSEGITAEEIELRDIRIQSMLILNKFLKQSGITFTESDTDGSMFSDRILKKAKVFKFSDNYTCFIGTATGILGNIGDCKEFFQKMLLVQYDRIGRMQNTGRLESFMSEQFEEYVNVNILRRLAAVPQQDYAYCRLLVQKILELYREYYHGRDEVINEYMQQSFEQDTGVLRK